MEILEVLSKESSLAQGNTAFMVYIFDTSSLHVFRSYFPEQFPTLWERLDAAAVAGTVRSVREVRRELERQLNKTEEILEWTRQYTNFFPSPTAQETEFVAKVFREKRFQALIGEKQRVKGYPVADPFLIAAAKKEKACVVTEESIKPNSAKIPVVCKYYGIQCVNMRGFLSENRWSF